MTFETIEEALQDEYGFRCSACLYAYWLKYGHSRPSHNHEAKGAAADAAVPGAQVVSPAAPAKPQTSAAPPFLPIMRPAPAKPSEAIDRDAYPPTRHSVALLLDYIRALEAERDDYMASCEVWMAREGVVLERAVKVEAENARLKEDVEAHLHAGEEVRRLYLAVVTRAEKAEAALKITESSLEECPIHPGVREWTCVACRLIVAVSERDDAEARVKELEAAARKVLRTPERCDSCYADDAWDGDCAHEDEAGEKHRCHIDYEKARDKLRAALEGREG